jgi:hypothetical protein
MPSSYQQRIKEKEQLEDKLEKEQVVKGGVMNIASKLNYEKQVYMNKTGALFDIIIKYGNEQALREAYKTIGQSVLVKYEAIVGKKTNKKGEEYDCWVSVWDKYAGKMTTHKKPPLCNGYVKYINDEDFDYDETSKKFVYKYDKATLNNKEVNIVKD